jgi:hypothetical protein
MSTPMLRTSYAISAPILARFNALTPPGERSRLVEQLLLKALQDKENALEQMAAEFMADPANAESIADEAAWDAAVADGLAGV